MSDGTCAAPDCDKPRKTRDSLCSMHRARWSRHKTFDYVGHKPVPLAESITARIVRDPDCWGWTGYYDIHGYAKIRRGKQNIAVHRWMYEHHVGPLVDGMVIDHACGNTRCVNPAHLRQVSIKQNVEHFTAPLRSHNTSGYRGVTFHKPSGLWMARVKSREQSHTSYHRTVEEAAAAAQEARLALHTHNDLDRMSMVRGV